MPIVKAPLFAPIDDRDLAARTIPVAQFLCTDLGRCCWHPLPSSEDRSQGLPEFGPAVKVATECLGCGSPQKIARSVRRLTREIFQFCHIRPPPGPSLSASIWRSSCNTK